MVPLSVPPNMTIPCLSEHCQWGKIRQRPFALLFVHGRGASADAEDPALRCRSGGYGRLLLEFCETEVVAFSVFGLFLW